MKKSLFFFLIALQIVPCLAQNVITTIAGTGNAGAQNGPALSATFNRVTYALPDSKGNIFLTDYENQCIRKIDVNGEVSTFAGMPGASGFADGQGTAARFYRPFYMVIDATDNLYVCDAKNHAIRKISPQGYVTTLAGNGTNGLKDGIGAAAQFDHPYGICFDSNGDLIITDRFNHAIRKLILANNQVITLAGGSPGFVNGPLASAKFNAPHGIVHVGNEVYFIADRDNGRIRKIEFGQVSTFAGSGTEGYQDGSLATAKFSILSGIDVDAAGNIYIGDYGNNAIRKISGNTVATIAGNGAQGFKDGNPLTNCLTNPHGIWVSKTGSTKIIIADHFNHAVRMFSVDTTPTVVEPPVPIVVSIPNVFSPNDDDVNDFFNIYSEGITSFKIEIYNRWGDLVFTSNNQFFKWDGTFNGHQLPESVYFYILQYRDATSTVYFKEGGITLFR